MIEGIKPSTLFAVERMFVALTYPPAITETQTTVGRGRKEGDFQQCLYVSWHDWYCGANDQFSHDNH